MNIKKSVFINFIITINTAYNIIINWCFQSILEINAYISYIKLFFILNALYFAIYLNHIVKGHCQ